MAKPFVIEFTEEALEHLAGLRATDRAKLFDSDEENLKYEPMIVTKNRKSLRPNDLAPFELRVGKYRVYYKVLDDAEGRGVVIVAIGLKIASRVFIAGEEIEL